MLGNKFLVKPLVLRIHKHGDNCNFVLHDMCPYVCVCVCIHAQCAKEYRDGAISPNGEEITHWGHGFFLRCREWPK